MYLCACVYNIFSTVWLILFFKPVRKILIADLVRILGLKIDTTTKIEPTPIDYNYESENHFKHLQQCWDVEITRKL